MPEITEIAWFPWKADAQDLPANAELKALGPELSARPGLVASWFGHPFERPQSGEFINVWESEDAYRANQSSPLYTRLKSLSSALIDTSDPNVIPYHNAIPFSKPFSAVAAAPVVQLSSIFLPADVDKAAFEAAFDKVLESIYGSPPDGFVVGTHGWALEEVKGAKVFATASGWESIEKRLAAHAGISEKFAEVQKYSNVVEVHHTSFHKTK
ncbi:putative rieske domain-containing protein [Podospora aff. communis PSN243]|uniref:Rieske domain-containing protein n=1 Tax=Podospora aff. communis PSN243 TaxID=3040156 RepID=A0AAV9G626_9PEZI|nr:putative rieske domain-containing protein [Podospora aff. communis PSN243]